MSLTLTCSVLNCTNSSKSYSSDNQKKVYFFNFPKESKILSKWVVFTGRGHNWRPNDAQKLCSEHFQESAFFENNELTSCERKLLKSNAIPTIVKLDECDDDVEYVMEEDSDEEQFKDEENLNKRSVVTTATDSHKRRSKENVDTLAIKKRRENDAHSKVPKSKQHFAQQFMDFVGVYEPPMQTKKCTQQDHKSETESVIKENSTTYENHVLINNTTKSHLKRQEHIVEFSDDDCNDEEHENLCETVDAIRHKLNTVEKTLLNLLDQIDIIRKEVMKVAKSTKKSISTVKAIKNESQDGNGATNSNQNNCSYLKRHQRSDTRKSTSSTQSESNTFNRFPIQSADEFHKFNAELNTTPELEQFTVNMFKQTKHSQVEIFVEENLKNLIKENVAKSMSWSGFNSEYAVKNSPVVALLRDAVVTRFNCRIKSPAVNLIRLYFGK